MQHTQRTLSPFQTRTYPKLTFFAMSGGRISVKRALFDGGRDMSPRRTLEVPTSQVCRNGTEYEMVGDGLV
ncbi:hypothetical protein RSAG8_01585, partial [Rhizoctonia solani AG-8 WAC10335]